MKVKILIGLAALAAAAGAGAIVDVFGIVGSPSTASPQRYDHLSNAGTRVTVSARNANILLNGGGKSVLKELGARAGATFYAGPAATGGVCYAVGPTKTGGIAVLGCLDPAAAFPSADAPILDMSGIAANPRAHSVTFLELSGFAADGVAKVGLIDVNGVVHSAEVRDNIYYADLPRVDAAVLVALDTSGQEIFHRPLG